MFYMFNRNIKRKSLIHCLELVLIKSFIRNHIKIIEFFFLEKAVIAKTMAKQQPKQTLSFFANLKIL
jgi:hypothetical protein